MKEGKDIKSLLLQKQWEASFFQIVEQYSQRLLHCAFAILKDHASAQDALQEAYISIWKNLHKFKGESHPYTWCYSIVRNSALNELKKQKKHRSQQIESILNIQDHTPLKWEAQEVDNQLLNALNILPEKQRLVFELRYYQDLSFKEISTLTNTSIGALKANYHHAKTKIEKKLIGQLNLP